MGEKTQIPELSIKKPILLLNERVKVGVLPKGAFVESLIIDAVEVIYSPRRDNPKRGGIPILGPTPGPIENTPWAHLYPSIPSHGTDRKLLWKVDGSTSNKVTLSRTLRPKKFLFVGKLQIDIELLKNGLSISKTIINMENKPRETGHAFHPYFSTDGGVNFEQEEIIRNHPLEEGKAVIIKPGLPTIKYTKDGETYIIEASPPPTQTLLWSDKPDLYEAIEPWWSEIGKGIVIGPRESKTFTLKITK